MNGYDLTEDNRGLSLDGRIINIELVAIRNILWSANLLAEKREQKELVDFSWDMTQVCQDELDKSR
jgi:hypothetical protein